ncbi:pathogenesis-related protein 5-like [Aristolochia californica]|uniref:pathogenesis-related protein 5-like n=1 Tax=Aristolochia californica TaxID=171875 RepID=UPI0035DC307A
MGLKDAEDEDGFESGNVEIREKSSQHREGTMMEEEAIPSHWIPPTTLIEFTLDRAGGQDFYDTSLAGSRSGGVSAYGENMNMVCPPGLKVTDEGGAIIACKSACEAFNTDECCYRGAFYCPDTCNPNMYSTVFKQACPTAYSYAYDDKTITFTCKAPAYILTFCPRVVRFQLSLQS